ncbi:TIGR03032 family protein [Stieleria varia]|uniref:TIGR03032 family protein n=1 Tax=Stieleria varia TaxID=2528005 RepID=UPI0018D209F1|nr:TIGR03032 family protein [Stieleria varia]
MNHPNQPISRSSKDTNSPRFESGNQTAYAVGSISYLYLSGNQASVTSDDEGNAAQAGKKDALPMREINYRHSSQFVPILDHLGVSLLISTYAAGKVVSVGLSKSELTLGFSNFQQAMGIAVGKDRLAIGGPNLIWKLRNAQELASKIEPAGTYDRGYLARESFVTGNIHVHEMGWGRDGELWIVNTLFSCLCNLHDAYNFVPRWQPSFISELAPQDRCHLNGMCMIDGKPRYVTALGTSDSPRGWRDNKSDGGVVIDVRSNQVVASGFCMPHSPRWYQGKLYLLDSGRGRLVVVDPESGNFETIVDFPGYGRGLAFAGQFALIGMSKARETSVFGGVPICNDRASMRCGIVVVDMISAKSVAYLEFESGVEELFDVQVISDSKRTVICGPFPNEDGQTPVWVVPNSQQIDRMPL